MTLDEIFELWERDSKIDRSDLGSESLHIPELHHKYYKILSYEVIKLKSINFTYAEQLKIMTEYYLGQLSEDELSEHKLPPFPLRVLKQDLPLYLNSDKRLVPLQLKIAKQQEKIEALQSIVKIIIGRGFHIKNAIDFLKFKNGQ